LKSIEPWAVEKLVTTPSYQSQLGPSIDWESAWNLIIPSVHSQEESSARHKMKSENGADEVERFSFATSVQRLSYRLVYFPVYYYGYHYTDKEYKFFINGQSGSRIGERPYGIGVVGRAFDKIADSISSIFSGHPSHPQASPETIAEWKEIQKPAQ